MADKKKLADLGGIVCVDGKAGETIKSAISDGALLPGACMTVLTTGIIDGTDAGTVKAFTGILLPKYNLDPGTAVPSGELVEYVVPKAGRHYNVQIDDENGKAVGTGMIFSDTNDIGAMKAVAEVEATCVARMSRASGATCTFGEVVWGGS